MVWCPVSAQTSAYTGTSSYEYCSYSAESEQQGELLEDLKASKADIRQLQFQLQVAMRLHWLCRAPRQLLWLLCCSVVQHKP